VVAQRGTEECTSTSDNCSVALDCSSIAWYKLHIAEIRIAQQRANRSTESSVALVIDRLLLQLCVVEIGGKVRHAQYAVHGIERLICGTLLVGRQLILLLSRHSHDPMSHNEKDRYNQQNAT
jgi:hypothetical protein